MLQHIDTTHLQQFLDALPAAMALTDARRKIIWTNEEFLRVTGLAAKDLPGKSVDTLEKDIQSLFQHETVELKANKNRTASWLNCVSIELGDKILLYCRDATQIEQLIQERDMLRGKVAELNPLDTVTGIPNRRSLYQSLEQQTSRSRRYGNPLSVLILRLVNLDDYRQNYGEENANTLLVQLSQLFNDQMRWADVIGRMDDNEFLLILPETEEVVTHELRNKLEEHLTKIMLPGAEDDDFELVIDFGMAQWRKGDDVGLLMQRARQTLDENSNKKIAM